MADDRFNNYKERKRPQKHRPAGIDGDRQGERECSGDDGAYVRYEAEYRRQDAPKDRAWNAYEPQTHPDHNSKGAIDYKLSQKKSAKTPRRVVERRCSTLEVIRAGQPNDSVTEIFALNQNEYDKNDDDAGRRERMNERGDQSPQALQRTRIGLAYFHGNGRLWSR
jgi:hypothetical protein